MGKGINIGNAHSGNQHKTGRSGLEAGTKQSLDTSPEDKLEPGMTETKQKGKHGSPRPAGTSGKLGRDKKQKG